MIELPLAIRVHDSGTFLLAYLKKINWLIKSTARGLSCSTRDLHCTRWDPSWHSIDSLVAVGSATVWHVGSWNLSLGLNFGPLTARGFLTTGHQRSHSHTFTGASLVAQRLKSLPPMQETWVRSLGQEDPREGNGNPLQYSCLENPMAGGAW